MSLNIIFLAEVKWAVDVFPYLKKNPKINNLQFCKTNEELLKLNLNEFDILITLGWCQELNDICDKILTIGLHCAELDRYSYGTPLQLQINDGIKFSKHRTFLFTKPEKSNNRAHTHTRQYSHETDLDLTGNMDDILNSMTQTSIIVLNMFLNDYPDIKWMKWSEETIVRKKRTPIDSKITKEFLMSKTTEELYNFFRGLESPYPNAYIEDETGKLYFKKVSFKYN